MKAPLLVVSLLLISSALIADEFVLDHEFADGEIASGTEVNTNFQALEGKANEHDLDIPNGNAVLGDGLGNITTVVEGYDDPEDPVGSNNTALGVGALSNTNYGQRNTAVGSQALRDMEGSVGQDGDYTYVLAGRNNTAVGDRAMMSSTDGIDNTAIGASALRNLSGGNYDNTAVGSNAMVNINTAYANTAVGYFALRSSSPDGVSPINSSSNTAVGAFAMNHNQGGAQNVAVGMNALSGFSNGDSNTAVGWFSQWVNRRGSANTSVGAQTRVTGGPLSDGNGNTAIGALARVGDSDNSYSNSTALGSDASATADNQVTLGNEFVTSVVTEGKLTTKQVTWTNLSPKNIIDPILVYVNGEADWRPAADYLAVNWDESALNDELLALRQELDAQRQELMAIIEAQQEQIAALERVVSMDQFAAR